MKAYGVAGHRHHPEIHAQISKLSNKEVDFIFTPHLVPMIRGMLSTIYVKLSAAGLQANIHAVFEARYKDEQFVDVLPAGNMPETRSVRGSNQLRIALQSQADTGYLTIVVVQDNLVKGAAGQAVQNMNIMFGFEENAGLMVVPLLP
jgi:N-acetyl-gamma-glutamyl-phosphate reductase